MTTRRARHHASLARALAAVVATLAMLMVLLAPGQAANRPAAPARPTIVLVHGAWADTSSWSGVAKRLIDRGYSVTAVANPLRSLSGDAAYLRKYLDTIDGPVVLVGHSYGAAVITNAATGDSDVTALVYVDGSVPDEGMTVASLAGPDSALSVEDPTTVFDFVPRSLPPTPATDVYLKAGTFRTAFANGLPSEDARVLGAIQRPITFGALNEPSGVPAWRTIPSWYLIGTRDHVIPPAAQRQMAQRAGATISYVEEGHLGLISNPKAVTNVIDRAVKATR